MTLEGSKVEADKLLSDFQSLELVKRYKEAKASLESNKRLQDLKRQREDLQKSIRFLAPKEKEEAFKKARALEKEYQEDPLVINVTSLKEEIYQLLAPLQEANL
mgnify:CR=1 FL=1